jgi:hypothetical protein
MKPASLLQPGYLGVGEIDGRRVVPTAWIEESHLSWLDFVEALATVRAIHDALSA